MAGTEVPTTERGLYEEWKPLLEAQLDALDTFDEQQYDEEQRIEQVNGTRGLDAEGHFPVYRKPPRPFEDC